MPTYSRLISRCQQKDCYMHILSFLGIWNWTCNLAYRYSDHFPPKPGLKCLLMSYIFCLTFVGFALNISLDFWHAWLTNDINNFDDYLANLHCSFSYACSNVLWGHDFKWYMTAGFWNLSTECGSSDWLLWWMSWVFLMGVLGWVGLIFLQV